MRSTKLIAGIAALALLASPGLAEKKKKEDMKKKAIE